MANFNLTITLPDHEAQALAIIAASLGGRNSSKAHTNIGSTTGKPMMPTVHRSRLT